MASLVLRRIRWPDGSTSLDPEDYEVVAGGKAIGRIYRESSGRRVMWLWFVYGALPGRRNSGSADTLDESKAAWLNAWKGSLMR